jgi:hypothetical protein
MGYDFIWRHGRRPILITPNNRRIVLDVIDDVPYLPPSDSVPCASALHDRIEHAAVPGPVVISSGQVPNAPVADDDEVDEKRDLKAEALTLKHMLTHLPKNPHCVVCQRAKMENVKLRVQGGVDHFGYQKFGAHIAADTGFTKLARTWRRWF